MDFRDCSLLTDCYLVPAGAISLAGLRELRSPENRKDRWMRELLGEGGGGEGGGVSLSVYLTVPERYIKSMFGLV